MQNLIYTHIHVHTRHAHPHKHTHVPPPLIIFLLFHSFASYFCRTLFILSLSLQPSDSQMQTHTHIVWLKVILPDTETTLGMRDSLIALCHTVLSNSIHGTHLGVTPSLYSLCRTAPAHLYITVHLSTSSRCLFSILRTQSFGAYLFSFFCLSFLIVRGITLSHARSPHLCPFSPLPPSNSHDAEGLVTSQ